MTAPLARDSLELGSLASSTHHSPGRSSESSSRAPSSRRLSFDDEDPLNEGNLTPTANRHERSYSVSSAFDFATNLFPLTATTAGYAALGNATVIDPSAAANGATLEKRKTLTFASGLSLVIGMIIGSGIFSSPAQVNQNAGSLGASLLVWLFAGILAWTGAASYAELGGAIPLNGGSQAYLSKIFGEWAGFLFMWTSVLVLKPGSAAIIAIICGEYLSGALFGHTNDATVSPWIFKGFAFGALVLVTLLNCISTKLGIRFAGLFMYLKFIALLGVLITGIVVAATGWTWEGTPNKEWKERGWFVGTSHDPSQWAVALYAGLWAFDGWDTVNYVAGEFKNPTRDLPRVIHSALFIVIFFYIAANLAYFFVLPFEDIIATNTIAVNFGRKVLGPWGAIILALAVSGSCFGALNASTFTSSRLVYSAGKEGYLPEVFGYLGLWRDAPGQRLEPDGTISNRRNRLVRFIADDDLGLFQTPVNAMVLMALLTSFYILIGQFDTLITFSGVAGFTFYFSTVLGLIILRFREPELHRPYKTWITTPIIFCCVSLFLLSRALFARPTQSLIVVGFVLAGVPVYWFTVRRRRPRESQIDTSDRDGWRFWKRW